MKQPTIHNTFKPVFAPIGKTKLGNINTYFLNEDKCEICKIEWIFNVGSKNQHKPLVANVCANLLLEGTNEYSSREFSTKLDELGAYFNVEVGKDFTTFTLHVLSNQLQKALAIIFPIFETPSLSDKEFKNLITELKQEFEQNIQKGSFIAQQKLMNALFVNHSYGKTAVLEDFNQLSIDDIIIFAKAYFIGQAYTLYVSGNANKNTLSCLEDQVKKQNLIARNSGKADSNFTSVKELQKIKHPIAQQDSLRLGQIVPDYTHPDFSAISIVNTILGGYFGSRLMQNIREDKGWTYGISSSIVPNQDVCYQVIASDILEGKGEEALQEINTEILSLHHELVSEEELSAVKSYLKGNLLRGFDGVFEQMDKFISVNIFNLSQEHYSEYLHLLDSITPQEIQNIAQKYFRPENFSKILVAK